MDEYFMFRLKDALQKKGITRTELSRLSGVSKGDITHYLKGDYVPKQDKCYLLAKALDVDPGWLMTGYEPNEPSTKELMSELEKAVDAYPETPEARILAKGIDKMPKAQREAIVNMMMGLYPGLFEKGNEDDDT